MSNDAVVTVLDEDAVWEHLATANIARIAVSVGGRPDIFPVNYVVDGRRILIRTNPGDKLLELTINEHVALEVDHYTDVEAWSVVVKGVAERLERDADVDEAVALGLSTLVPIDTEVFVRIEPVEVNGRAFDLTRPRPQHEL